MNRHWVKIAAASLAVVAAQAAATPQVQLPAEAAYKSTASGIEFAPLSGFSRRVTLFGDTGLDIGIDYRSDSANEEITFFLVRRVAGDAALWLDRVGKVVMGQDRLGEVSPALAPFPLATPGGGGGLGVAYSLTGKQLKSTGAAVFASADWYVAIRATSAAKSPEELKAWMASAATSVRWPADQQPLAAPAPIQPCSKPVGGSDKARFHVPALSALLVKAALAHNVENERKEKIADPLKTGSWCVDSDLSPMASVYRHPDDRKSYFLAVADAGRGYTVGEEPLMAVLDPTEGQSYFVTWIDLDHVDGYAAFDRLPAPAIVQSFVKGRAYAFRASTWGTESNISFNADVANKK
jgi:hypothetical protein